MLLLILRVLRASRALFIFRITGCAVRAGIRVSGDILLFLFVHHVSPFFSSGEESPPPSPEITSPIPSDSRSSTDMTRP